MTSPYGGPPQSGPPQDPYQQPYGQPVPYGSPYGQPAPYGAPYGQPPPYGYQPYPVSAPTNGLGVGGFVCSLIGLLFFWFPFVGLALAVIGTVLSGLGLTQGNKDGSSTGMAVAGLVLGVIALIPGILWIVLFSSY